MGRVAMMAGVLAMGASAASAGGIERSTQPIGVLFEEGANYVELSYGRVRPSVDGTGVFTGIGTGGVAGNHYLPGIAIKHEFNDKLSGAFIYDHFYGADIEYPATGAPELAGTYANLQSEGYTALLRYKFNENFSAHGGVRFSNASAAVGLSGLGYGAISGYKSAFGNSWGTGYVIGAAYEKPEIALRVALTYQSKVKHSFDTIETAPVFALVGLPASVLSTTDVNTPEAINLDFQTGIAPNWLAFGSIRWVHWKQFKIDPVALNTITGSGLVDLENSTTYTLGVGHKFNDTWSGSVFATWENVGGDKNVSPLAPTDGYKGIGVAAIYKRDNMKVTAGVRYLKLGDASAATAGAARANFNDNYAVAAGIKVGFTF